MTIETLAFKKRPSSLMTIIKAVKKRNIRFKPGLFNPVSTLLQGMPVDKKHLAAYYDVCDVQPSDTLSLLYPLTLIYPFNIRLISSKNVPLVMFKMLNIHTTLISYRKIQSHDLLDVHCGLTEYRVLGKGLEIDIRSTISANGLPAWECTNTFYFRGEFKDSAENPRQYFHQKIDTPDDIYQWRLPNENGLRFAHISGDSNPLHYSKLYAVLMGFERDFAQPFLVSEKVMSLLGKKAEERPVKVDLFYKGQVYYGKQQTIKRADTPISTTFEVFCDGNDRPSIHGIVADLP